VAKGGLDLDAELDHLYAAPPSEFTSTRNALVKTLEAAGRKRGRRRRRPKPPATTLAARDGKGSTIARRLLELQQEFTVRAL
jgi:hypothetical protein